MTDGTSQGLFIVVAIVIFGIFVAMAYILFEDTLSPAIASMMETATEQAANRLNKDTTIGSEGEFIGLLDKYEDTTFTYTFNESTKVATLTGFVEGKESTSVTIPDAVEKEGINYKVTHIGKEAFLENGLLEVTLSNTVEVIGFGAFALNSLTVMEFPNNIKEIGQEAFTGNMIQSITLEEGLLIIGEYAFGGNQLTSLYIPDSVVSIADMAFIYNYGLENMSVSLTTELGENLFGETSNVPISFR